MNIVTLTWGNEEDTAANMIASAATVLLLLVPVFIFTILYINNKNLDNP